MLLHIYVPDTLHDTGVTYKILILWQLDLAPVVQFRRDFPKKRPGFEPAVDTTNCVCKENDIVFNDICLLVNRMRDLDFL